MIRNTMETVLLLLQKDKTEYARDVDIGTVATMRVVQQSVSLP